MNTLKVKKNTTRIYLACPYSHPDEKVRLERLRKVTATAAYLMEQFGYVVFSPITHSHYVAEYLDNHLDHEFWLTQDASHMDSCDELYVLRLDGWKDSFGVAWELGFSASKQMPVWFIDWAEVQEWLSKKLKSHEAFQIYTERQVCQHIERIDGHA